MGPHLRNEGFFIGFIVVWAIVNSSYSYCPYFVCPLKYTGQLKRGVCRIITLFPALDLHVPVYICTVSTALAVRDDSNYFLLPNLPSRETIGRVPKACGIFNTYSALLIHVSLLI